MPPMSDPAFVAAERPFWLAWSRVPGIGPVLLLRLRDRFGTLSAAWHASEAEIAGVSGIGTQILRAIAQVRQQTNPIQLLQEHEQKNPLFWTPTDPGYPRLLQEIPDRPAVVYAAGDVQSAETQGQTPLVAIVGTREPSEYGRRWTRKLSRVLAQQGFTVISGLAEGIDTEAHQACLEAGGRTIGVLGTGVDVVYPIRNQMLYQQVQAQGWIMSEYPAGTQPDRVHFPRRNRIIAAMSRAVLVMEAPSKSGALITAHLANDYGRDVFVLPGSLDSPQSQGCLGLLSKGAQAILSEGHLLELLGMMPQLDPPTFAKTPIPGRSPIKLNRLEPIQPQPDQPPPELSAPLQHLWNCLSDEPTSMDGIVTKSQLSIAEVNSLLVELEIQGWVKQIPGMRYQKISKR